MKPRTSTILQDTLAVILAGGQGERLYPLTKHRAKPAVPFGGIYRIIDFALSNCINSQLKRICVLTQYKSDSLDRHIRLGWNIFHYDRGRIYFYDSAAISRVGKVVSGNGRCGVSEHLHDRTGKSGICPHSLRRSHLQDGLQRTAGVSRRVGADVTVSTIEFPRESASTSGRSRNRRQSAHRRFRRKTEKPQSRCRPIRIWFLPRWASMFSTRRCLIRALLEDAEADTSHDFGRNIIPNLIGDKQSLRVQFQGPESEGSEILARCRNA